MTTQWNTTSHRKSSILKALLSLSALIAVAALPVSGAHAASMDWDSDTDGDYETAANWTTDTLPGGGDTANVSGPGNTSDPTLSGTVSLTTLNVSGTGNFTIDTTGDLTATTANLTGGTVQDDGTLSLTTLNISGSGDLTISGTGDLTATTANLSAGTMQNAGTFTITTLNVSGTGDLTITGTGNATTVNLSSGTIDGAGTLNGTTIIQTGGVLSTADVNAVSYQMTGGTAPASPAFLADGTLAAAFDSDGANIDANYSVVAIGGTVSANDGDGIDVTNNSDDIYVQTGSAGINANGNILTTVAGNGITTSTTEWQTVIQADGDVDAAGGVSGNAIDATSTTGNILVTGAGEFTGNATSGNGIDVSTTTGDITVSGTGATTTSAVDSIGINAVATGNGFVVVNRSGAIVNTGTGETYGIYASAGGSDIVDIDSGAITLNNLSTGVGIYAESTGGGNVTVDNGGTINGGAYGIWANSTGGGSVTVTSGAAIGNTDAPSNTAIVIDVVDGTGQVNAGHDLDAGTVGIQANSAGSGTLDINQTAGTITSGIGIYAESTASGQIDIDLTGASAILSTNQAVWAYSTGTGTGAINIDATGDVINSSSGAVATIEADIVNADSTAAITINHAGIVNNTNAAGTGIEASSVGTGDVSVTANVVNASIAGDSIGISAQSTNAGGGNVEVISTGDIDAGGIGILATNLGAGTVTVTQNAGATIGGTNEPTDAGIQTSAVNGATQITVNGTVNSSGIGVDAESTGSGTIDIDLTGASAIDAGNQAVRALSATAGTGAINIDATAGAVTSSSGAVATIDAYIDNTGSSAAITINHAGIVNNTNAAGTGIDASSVGTGDVSVTANVVNASIAGDSVGISAQSDNAGGGNVEVISTGNIDAGNIGIYASNLGAGTVTVTQNAGATIGGTNEPTVAGIQTTAVSGATQITVNGTVNSTGIGVDADSTGANGTIDIELGTNGLIDSTGGTGAGIAATTTGGTTATITIHGNSGVVIGATDGMDLDTAGAAILVDNLDSVTGLDGDGIDAASVGGTITVTAVDAVTGNGGHGILADSGTGAATGGDIDIQGSGTVDDITGTAFDGINADAAGDPDGGDITIGNTVLNGIILGEEDGIDANTNGAGTITIVTGAAGTVTGTTGLGIEADTEDGDITITANADVSGATDGISAVSSGAGTVSVGGSGAVGDGTGDGIEAATATGSISITGTGTTSGGDAGIDADITGGGTGTILITRSGDVTGGSGGGINADSNSSGSIQIVSGNVTATNLAGIHAVSTGDGTVNVTNGGTVNGVGGGLDDGILASTTGNGTVTVATGATIGNTGAPTDGIDTAAEDGMTTISVSHNVTATTIGVNADGDGTGEIEVNLSDGVLQATAGGGIGIDVDQASTGEVDINVSGGSLLAPQNLVTVNGDGLINVNIANTTVSSTTGDSVQTVGTAGATTVDVDVDLVSTGAAAISSQSTTGDISIVGDGNLTGATDAILTDATTGITIISQTGTTTGSGAGGDAIDASSTSGTIDINVTEDATGGSGDGVAVRATSTAAGGAITINNDAGTTISSVSQNAIVVSSATGVANQVNNDGSVIGTVTGGDGNETIGNNDPGSLWAPSDLDGGASINDLGDGTDIVNNAGTVQLFDSSAFPGVTTDVTISGLETFNNQATGILDMQNGNGNDSLTTDRLTISNSDTGSTDYVGTDGSELLVDTFLGANPSPSDLVTIGTAGGDNNGSTAGSTLLVMNDTNTGFAGFFNPVGAEVVRVESAATQTDRSHFTLDGGPVDKGLWLYDLFLDDTRDNPGRATADVFVIASVPDQEAHEMTQIVDGAQEIFHESTRAMVDRQGDLRNSATLGKKDFGVWAHAFGAAIARDKDASYTLFNQTYSYDVSYGQNVMGLVTGFDYTFKGFGSGEDYIMAGISLGVMYSSLEFDASSTIVEYSAQTYGAYVTYLNKGLYVDLLLKMDQFGTDWDAATLADFAGYAPQSFDGQNFGGRLGVGYKMNVGDKGIYVDPFAKLTYVTTSIDQFTVLETQVDLGDNDSMRAQAGARVGKAFHDGKKKYDVYASASIVGETMADNQAIFRSGTDTLNLSNDNSFQALNVGAGFNFSSADSDWSIITRVNAEVGDGRSAYSGEVGINLKF